MIKKIYCLNCGQNSNLPVEDIAAGWHLRKTRGIAKKPKEHSILIQDALTNESIDLPYLLCDLCGSKQPDGTNVFALTYWRNENEPDYWELGFFRRIFHS